MASLAQVARPQSVYQSALDYAENQRNFVNQAGQPLTAADIAGNAFAGGSDGAGYNSVEPDLSQPLAVPNNTPHAYNLLGANTAYDTAADAYAQLARARQFDPNATVTHHFEQLGGEGSGRDTYSLDFDTSKLPALSQQAQDYQGHGGRLSGFGGYGQETLFNQGNVINDPNYGPLTDPRNIDHRHTDDEGLLAYAPMLIAALASFGAAAPALAAGNATLGSFSTGAGGALANGLVNGARAIGNGGGLSSLIPAAISLGGSALGAPSWATSAANAGYGLTQGRKPSPIGAGTSLAQLAINSVGPGG